MAVAVVSCPLINRVEILFILEKTSKVYTGPVLVSQFTHGKHEGVHFFADVVIAQLVAILRRLNQQVEKS
jgi:hypothetical protein